MGTSGEARRPRVLIADDAQETRVLLQAYLEESGINVIASAPGGTAAVRLASELGPDVIVMDIRMPDIDGLEATRLIKQSSPKTQVILVTFYDDIMWNLGARQARAYCCLLKGGPPATITEAIRRAWSDAGEGSRAETDGLAG